MSLSVQYHERRFALLLLILILTTCISQCLLIFNTKLLFFTLKLITVLIESYSCFSSNFHPVILGFISKSWLLQLLLQRSHTEKWFIVTVVLFSVCVCVCVCVHACTVSPSVVSNSFATQQTVAHQVPLSMELPRQEYWSGLPSPTSGNRPDPGIEAMSLASPSLAGGFFTTVPPGKPYL